MSVPAQMETLATRLPVVLGHAIASGQIRLRFENGVLKFSGAVPAELRDLAMLLRNTFGKPVHVEEIAVNFSSGILQSLERHAQHYDGIETREYFRVQSRREKT